MFKGYFVGAKVVASGVYLYLLQAPFGAVAAIEHHPNVPAQYYLLRSRYGKDDDENQCDASIMHRALNSLIGINRN
jgi:hypothetical protein